MKKWSVMAAVAVFVVLGVAGLVRDFVTNDPIGYFSTEPQRLLYVGVIAIVGGLLVLGFDRIPPRAKRQTKVMSLGAAASTVTVLVGYFALVFLSFRSSIIESLGASGTAWVALGLLGFSGLAAYLWFEFRRALKLGVS